MAKTRWFSHCIRVRYQETDQMGVVYHANYLNWFEIARTELVRELGMPYRALESTGILLPVVDLAMKFSRPARYDDQIRIYTKVERFTNIRLEFCYDIRKRDEDQGDHTPVRLTGPDVMPDGQMLVSGKTSHVWLQTSWRPARIDKQAPELYEMLKRSFGGEE